MTTHHSDSSRPRRRNALATVCLVILAVAAWQSNPDQESFRQHFRQKLADQLPQAIPAGLGKPVASWTTRLSDITHIDYGFGSSVTVRLGQRELVYLGVFGSWIRVR